MSDTERRGSIRIETPQDQMVSIKSAYETTICAASDISTRGACTNTDIEIPVGSFVNLVWEASAPDSSFEIRARIVWRKTQINGHSHTSSNSPKFRYGMLFHQPSQENLNKVQEFCSRKPLLKSRRVTSRRDISSLLKDNLRRYDRRGSKDFLKRTDRLAQSFDKWKSFHTYFRFANDGTKTNHFKRKKILLGSNSYLGLSFHPEVKEAAVKAIEKFGVGSGGVPPLSGTTPLHEELCDELAKFKGTEAAILFSAGYIANYACISTLFNAEDDILLNDEINHASIVEGCRRSNGKLRFYKHNKMEDLEHKLQQYDINQTKIIIADGVFSMEGDVCNLPGIYTLAKKYNALVMVDDAHATGVMGPTGRGTAEHFNMVGKTDLTTVTLSKAIGCIGGAICGSRGAIKNLTHISRAHNFSTSLPPSICAAATAAIRIIQREPIHLETLRKNVRFLTQELQNLGYNVLKSESAIIPVIIGDEILTYKLVSDLDEMGIFVNAVSRPAVPRELSRLRVSPTSILSMDDLEKSVQAFKLAGKKLGII